jgi:hypothetical protein
MRDLREHQLRRLGAGAALIALAACANRDSNAARFGDATALSATTTVGTAPMFAVAPGGTQAAAWVSAPGGGIDGRLYVAVGGGTPTEIRDTLGPIEAHGESPPKIAYGGDGSLYALYTVGKVVPGQRFPQSALRLVKSTDGGSHWTAPVTVTDGAVFGSHSFHALHTAPDGTIYVSWLGKADGAAASGGAMKDTASMAPAMKDMPGMTGMSHAAHEASAAWISRSTDGGATWTPRVRVDLGEACPCCRTALASTKDGRLFMAWRHVFPGNVRDVVVARSDDRGATWSTPERVHADNWVFDACPHAGPALAVDSAGLLHVAWWTGREGSAGVYYSQSRDGAHTFSAPIALGVAQFSRPAHVQLGLTSKNDVIVAWEDGTRAVPEVLVRVSRDGGAHFGDALPLSDGGRASTFPVLGIAGDSVAVAWSDESASDDADTAGQSMRDKNAPAALHAVGETRVLVRRGVLR